MADSCRPVSRHGRYHSANRGIPDVQYTDKLQTYSTPSYGDNEGFYMSTSPLEDEPLERPTTSRGHRRMRPQSRGGRKEQLKDDEESEGRPASRRGFTPETFERLDYDEFSHQGKDIERRLTPDYRGSPQMTLSYSPDDQRSPYRANKPPIGPRSPYRESPLSKRYSYDEGQSRTLQRQSPHDRKSSYDSRMSPGYDLTSPQAYESQQKKFDYEHSSENKDPTSTTVQPDVLQIEESWSVTPREKPPTSRPKSSRRRLKSGRKKHQESQQMQETAAIDTPILRPPSSLSKYRPLPAINGPYGSSQTSMETELDAYHRNPERKMSSASDTGRDLADITSKTQNLTMGLGERTKTLYSMDLHNDNDSSKEKAEVSMSRSSSYGANVQTLGSSQTPVMNSENTSKSSSTLRESLANKFQFTSHVLPQEPSEEEDRIQLAIRLPDGRRHLHYFRVAETLELVLHFAENISGMYLTDKTLASNAPRAIFTDISLTLSEAGIPDKTVLHLEEKD